MHVKIGVFSISLIARLIQAKNQQQSMFKI
jgi:hypothetical protein